LPSPACRALPPAPELPFGASGNGSLGLGEEGPQAPVCRGGSPAVDSRCSPSPGPGTRGLPAGRGRGTAVLALPSDSPGPGPAPASRQIPAPCRSLLSCLGFLTPVRCGRCRPGTTDPPCQGGSGAAAAQLRGTGGVPASWLRMPRLRVGALLAPGCVRSRSRAGGRVAARQPGISSLKQRVLAPGLCWESGFAAFVLSFSTRRRSRAVQEQPREGMPAPWVRQPRGPCPVQAAPSPQARERASSLPPRVARAAAAERPKPSPAAGNGARVCCRRPKSGGWSWGGCAGAAWPLQIPVDVPRDADLLPEGRGPCKREELLRLR